jgi:hypothetical protein
VRVDVVADLRGIHQAGSVQLIGVAHGLEGEAGPPAALGVAIPSVNQPRSLIAASCVAAVNVLNGLAHAVLHSIVTVAGSNVRAPWWDR